MATGLGESEHILQNGSGPQLGEPLLQELRPKRAMALEHLFAIDAFFLELGSLE
jgi:hypothetical protein